MRRDYQLNYLTVKKQVSVYAADILTPFQEFQQKETRWWQWAEARQSGFQRQGTLVFCNLDEIPEKVTRVSLKFTILDNKQGFPNPVKLLVKDMKLERFVMTCCIEEQSNQEEGGGENLVDAPDDYVSNILLNTFLNLFMFQVNKIFDQPGRECTVP